MVMLLVAGIYTYATMPRESDPDIDIPIIMVQVALEGISPTDGERLMLRPIEKELKTIAGIKEMRATAAEGYAYVVLEFDAGFNADKALNDVRAKVDRAKPELPTEAKEPVIEQFNVSLFPILLVTLSGDVEQRTLLNLARDLKTRVETLPQVLSATIAGDREQLLEIIVDPVKLEAYNISQDELVRAVTLNNRLVAAGSLDTGQGRFAIKVPGIFERAEDVLDLPVKVEGDGVVTLSDVTSVRRTFKDPESLARIDGKPAVTLEIKKRTGQNVIDAVNEVKRLTLATQAGWPATVRVAFGQDASKDIHDMLGELQNGVLLAVLLVMVVVVGSLGMRSSALVGIAVPGSFLFGLLCLHLMGLTLNTMVMFSMILVVGMVVDGAIIVVEYADRKMVEGLDRKTAYRLAAQRMAWPVISTTATTGLVFAPLLFWPGVTGKFMSYLPLSLLLTLFGSILVALVFIPVLGAMFGKPGSEDEATLRAIEASETGDVRTIPGLTGLYARVVGRVIHHPVKVLGACLVVLVVTLGLYARYGKGVEFFPAVEPRQALVFVHARGNLSIAEKDRLVQEVEARVRKIDGMVHVYGTTGGVEQGQELGEDVIGQISLEFREWNERRPAAEILAEVIEKTRDIAGIRIETRLPDAGPPTGKKIQIEIGSDFPDKIPPVVDAVRRHLDGMKGLVDVEDTRPLPGIEWQLKVDRAQAGLFGADVAAVGNVVQLVTNGIKIGEYRPDDATKEVDIRVRFPLEDRSMARFDQLRVQTPQGLVPISSFVTRTPEPLVGTVTRTDGRRVMMVRANTAPGVLPDDKVNEIRAWLATQEFGDAVHIRFKGQDKEQAAAADFLSKAFVVGIFLMTIVLITQFNSFYFTFVILSAVLLSTVGVFVALLVTGQVFSMVMTGIGVISLAGVVVAHNIVLLDTYVQLRRDGMEAFEAILRTSVQRLRPVMLTTITTMIGLVPMALQFNIDFFSRAIEIGAPSTQYWVQMATAIIFGLAFATLLTLVVTPSLVTLSHVLRKTWAPRLRRLTDRKAGAGARPQPAE
jgi:multidrug efflux pump